MVEIDEQLWKKMAVFYSRDDIQQQIVLHAKNKECVGRFRGEGYGKRPDVILEKQDIVQLFKSGVTSFHCSEELWQNPLRLQSGASTRELNQLRIGWDLILDIDCPVWEFAKIITYLFIRALKDHNINTISLKFSGNKGFHIGVPFESFPPIFNKKNVKDLFPEAPRKISKYLVDYIANKYVKVDNDNNIYFGNYKFTLEEISEKFQKSPDELTLMKCTECMRVIKKKAGKSNDYICEFCGNTISSEEDYMICEKCGKIMTKIINDESLCECGNNNFFRIFDPLKVVEVDTILISPRHLYRMPFSFHEKSGLVSIPIKIDSLMRFEKKMAEPDSIKIIEDIFIDRSKAQEGEAEILFKSAYDYDKVNEMLKQDERKEYILDDEMKEAIPKEFFPPCIKKILEGLEDGRKRALFTLLNFLRCVGWSYEQIEQELKEWNKRNKEPLSMTYLLGQISHHKKTKNMVLPPNCDNKAYYIDMRICDPEPLCKKIKNPVNCAKLKYKSYQRRSRSDKKTKD